MGALAMPAAAVAPVAADVSLPDVPIGTVVEASAIDIVSSFAADADGGLTAASLSFDSATIESAPVANPAAAGFSYTPQSGTAGSFTIDPTVAAFSGLGSGGSADVVVSFTVTDPDLGTDTGTLSYTVVGDAGPYDEVAFDHRGPEVPGAEVIAERVVDPGLAEALVALVGPTTLVSAMGGFDLAALEAPASAPGRGVALAIAIDDSSATATTSDGSVATATATGASTATAFAGDASSVEALGSAQSTANAVALDGSTAVGTASTTANVLTFAQGSSLAGAYAADSASAVATSEDDSAASGSAENDSTATASANQGSAAEATAATSGVANADATNTSSATANAYDGSEALAQSVDTSSATAFAHTASDKALSMASDSSITNAVAIDTAAATATANDGSDALALGQSGGSAIADSDTGSSANAGAAAGSTSDAGADDSSTSIADADGAGSAVSDADVSSVSFADADTGADATAGVCRDRVAWAVGEEGATTSAQVPQDLEWPELTDEAPSSAGLRLPASLATPAGVVTYLPFDVVGAGGAIDEVVLRGFPAGTTFSAGTATVSDGWLFTGVPPSDLTFTLPTGFTGTFLLDVTVNTGGDDVAFSAAPTEVVVGGDATLRGEGQTIAEVTAAATVRKAQLADRAMDAITEVTSSGAPVPELAMAEPGASGGTGEASSNAFTCGPEADPSDLPVEVARYVPITPCRVVDTRQPGAGGAFGNREIRDYVVRGSGPAIAQQGGNAGGCGIPDEALGVE
ncbi:MAG: hypothetical protein KDA98_08615, partial [Acidimicrobiales bacterium]|nr:hypothetical protein [Acidimicrobiales bacterium]